MDISGFSQSESGSQTPQLNNLPQLRLQQNSFSSYRSINLGRANSPQSQEQEYQYILRECRKLIKTGKYYKAFINLRRYLMDQELSKSVLPEFYQQVVHCCLKIIEKYFVKSTSKILSKVPPLMSMCFQYLNHWESFLVNLQSDQDCQHLIFGKSQSAQEQALIKKHSLQGKQQESYSPLINSPYKQSLFMKNQTKNKARENNENEVKSSDTLDGHEDIKEMGKIEIGNFNFEQNGYSSNDLYQEEEEDKFDAVLLIKDKFHLHREQMLTYYLKTLFLSYRFHRIVNQPMRSLKFLMKGSDIVRDFLDNLLFISSAELSRIASKIELTRGNIHMELNQVDKAQQSYKCAHYMGRNSMEIWFKIIGEYSKQDIPIKLEQRCEKSIIQFISILLVQSTCYEVQNQYSRALETISLADWFATKLLLYESSNHLKEKIQEHYSYIKEKYSDFLKEEGEINKILRKFEQKEVNLQEIRLNEDIIKKQKLQDDFNNYLYEKAQCKEINNNYLVFVRNPPSPIKENNRSSAMIISSENLNYEPNNKFALHLESGIQSPILSQTQLFNGKNGIQNNIISLEHSRQQISAIQDEYVKNPQVSNKHQNRSLSEVPSFYNEQTTQLTGGAGISQTHTSKFYSFYGNKPQNKQKQVSGGNAIDQTIGSGGISQLNSNHQSVSYHGLDLQSIINYPQNQNLVNPSISSQNILPQNIQNKNEVNETNLNASFHNQTAHNTPVVYSSFAFYGNQQNAQNNNNGGISNNSSFNGQQLVFNNNNGGSIPMMSDCHFIQGNFNNGQSAISTPRNQDISSVDPMSQSSANHQNILQFNKGHQQPSSNSFQQNSKINFDRRGTLEQTTYQFMERPSSAQPASSISKHFPKNYLQNNSEKKKKYNNKKNVSLNSHDISEVIQKQGTPQYRNSVQGSSFYQQHIGSKNHLGGDYQNEQYKQLQKKLDLLQEQNNQEQNTLHRFSIQSATKLDSQKKQSENRKSFSYSKLGTMNNINNKSYQSNHNQKQKNNQSEGGRKLKVITSELYLNKHPPVFTEEPEKIEQLKQKYRFMRDDENDVREAQQKNEVKYQFMKIPLDERYDLIDLDICMKKVIQEQLVAKTDFSHYPHMHWVCGKTLQQSHMDKKEIQFGNIMVQFKQKNGNGKSIPQILEQEDTMFSMQRELKTFNEQTALAQAKERLILEQNKEQMLDNQAFQKVLGTDKPKEQKTNQDFPLSDLNQEEMSNKGSIIENMRTKMIKAAEIQKSIDDGHSDSINDSKVGLSMFANVNQSLAKSVFNKKKVSNSHHTTTSVNKSEKTNISQQNTTNDGVQQAQIDKADFVLKQIVLQNEQERERINKQIEEVQNKHTKIGMKQLILTLQDKEDKEQIEQQKNTYKKNKKKQSASQKSFPVMNQSSAVNDNNETALTDSDDSEDKSIVKSKTFKLKKSLANISQNTIHNQTKNTKQTKQQSNINPTYFNLSYLKQEFGNMQTAECKTSNVAFEVDRFLSLAQSTKNLQQMKLFKQNPFNITNVALFHRIKNQEMNNGGGSTKSHNRHGQRNSIMPRRFTLLAQSKQQD